MKTLGITLLSINTISLKALRIQKMSITFGIKTLSINYSV
jgi:hypothetical protein